MTMLTDTVCAEWLTTRGIAEAPHSRAGAALPHAKVRLPAKPLRQAAISRQLVATCEPFECALLQFTDWPFYKADEMAVLCGLRSLHGDSRPLIESPGHLFAAAERDLLIGMLSLAIYYGYSAYLYFDHGATVLCWEGDILDFWCSDESRASEAAHLLHAHGVDHGESGDA